MSGSEEEILVEEGTGEMLISRLALKDSSSEAEQRLKISRFQKPTSANINQNMDDIEKLLHHLSYNELRIAPEEHGFLVTEHVFMDRTVREKLTQLLFENLNVPQLMFLPQEFLSCISAGRETALIVNVGHSTTSIVPIWNLNILRDKAMVIPVGGRDVTKALQDLMVPEYKQYGLYGPYDIREDTVQDIVHKLAYVSPDFEEELANKAFKKQRYEFPDGQEVELGHELFLCTECLFDPGLVGYTDTPGLIESVSSVYSSLDPEMRKEISLDLILAGSSSMLRGLQERLEVGLKLVEPRIKVIAPPERKQTAWIGGSIWSSLMCTRNWWTRKEEYDEYGPTVVHSKCI